MTRAEYARRYVQARQETARLSVAGNRRIHGEYARIIAAVGQVLREHWRAPDLEARIRGVISRQGVYETVLSAVQSSIEKGTRFIAAIEKEHLLDALKKIPGSRIDREKTVKMFDGLIEEQLAEVSNAAEPETVKNVIKMFEKSYTGTGWGGSYGRSGKTGKERGKYRWNPDTGKSEWIREMPVEYTFKQSHSLSKRVWDLSKHTEEDILNVVWGGRALGRDPAETARDLEAYLKPNGGKIVQGRWGKLRPDSQKHAQAVEAAKTAGLNPRTAEGQKFIKDFVQTQTRTPQAEAYYKRLGSAGLDYRALRIHRTETYRNMQESVKAAADMNPAISGQFDWVLQPGREVWPCKCKELHDAGPYTKDTIPVYPHPNCDCQVRPRLKDSGAFMQQLLDYADGRDTPGAREIEQWADKYDLEKAKAMPANPDQPDFTVDTPKPESIYKSFDEFASSMKEKFGTETNGFYVSSNLKDLDLTAMSESAKGIGIMLNEFPMIKKILKGFDVTYKEDAMMTCNFNGIMGFKPKNYKTYKAAEQASKASGSIFDTTASKLNTPQKRIEGFGIHEAGHLVELALIHKNAEYKDKDQMEAAWNHKTEAIEVIDEAYKLAKSDKEYKGESLIALMLQISPYAKFDSSECLAEAITDYYYKSGQAALLSRMIYKVLKKKLGG